MLSFVESAELIGTDDVARLFGVDRSTVTRWVAAGKLTPVFRGSGVFLFDAEAVQALAEEQAS